MLFYLLTIVYRFFFLGYFFCPVLHFTITVMDNT